MPALLDTNVLARVRDAASPDHADCVALVRLLKGGPHDVVLCAQVLIEYWVVATRPAGAPANGLGLDPADVDADLADYLRLVPCLPEPPDILDRWRRLVVTSATRGKPAHDARLVAVMDHHAVTRLITLNAGHFAPFPWITCPTPGDFVRAGANPPLGHPGGGV